MYTCPKCNFTLFAFPTTEKHLPWYFSCPRCFDNLPNAAVVEMQLSPILPGTGEVDQDGLSWEVLKLGLHNLDVDVDCGACMEIFFTGSTTAMHEHVTNGNVLFLGDEI